MYIYKVVNVHSRLNRWVELGAESYNSVVKFKCDFVFLVDFVF